MQDTGVAPDTGADDTVDTNSSGETAEIDAAEPANDNGAGGETAAEKRIRLKWLGREEEIDDPRKLAERFSDEHEFEFKGPGGKPVKARWPDIERHVQLSAGAQERMKQANALRQQIQAQVDWAKENDYENLPVVLEQLYGIKDPEEFFYQRAAVALQRKAEMAKLAVAAENDPSLQIQFQRLLEQEYQAKQERKQKWGETQRQHQERAQKAQAERQQREGVLRNELKAAALPVNPHTLARAGYIEREQRELGLELEPRQLAYQLRQDLDKEWFERFDSMPDDQLLKFLGEKRRAKLREAELAATKAAQKQARAAAPPKKPASNGHDAGGNQAQPKSITDMVRSGWKS